MRLSMVVAGLLMSTATAFAQDAQSTNSNVSFFNTPPNRPSPYSKTQRIQYLAQSGGHFLGCVHAQHECSHLAEHYGLHHSHVYFSMQYCPPEPHLACYGFH